MNNLYKAGYMTCMQYASKKPFTKYNTPKKVQSKYGQPIYERQKVWSQCVFYIVHRIMKHQYNHCYKILLVLVLVDNNQRVKLDREEGVGQVVQTGTAHNQVLVDAALR